MRSIGIVLAGGESRRMGRDKALLRWRGAPLIEHQMASLRAAGVDEVRVSGERPYYGGILDAVSGIGPVGGLAGVARCLADDAELVIIPVDMPLLTGALLRRLRTAKPGAACLCYAGHVLPMRLRLDAAGRGCIQDLASRREARERSLRALQQALGLTEIALPPGMAGKLVDCNTAASYEEVAR